MMMVTTPLPGVALHGSMQGFGLLIHLSLTATVCDFGEVEAKRQKLSGAGNRTLVSRVTGGDTIHYTTPDGTLYGELLTEVLLVVMSDPAVILIYSIILSKVAD
jgi:hypothetical protein